MRIPSLLLISAFAAFAADRPNIVFLFSDDHALQAISAYGGRFKDIAPTPNIDLLGVTVVSGNTPMPAGMATGVGQLEALRSDTPIYAGSRYGIRNWRFDAEILAAEQALSPVVSWPGYLGHYDETIGGDPMADWVDVYQSKYGEAPSYEMQSTSSESTL